MRVWARAATSRSQGCSQLFALRRVTERPLLTLWPKAGAMSSRDHLLPTALLCPQVTGSLRPRVSAVGDVLKSGAASACRQPGPCSPCSSLALSLSPAYASALPGGGRLPHQLSLRGGSGRWPGAPCSAGPQECGRRPLGPPELLRWRAGRVHFVPPSPWGQPRARWLLGLRRCCAGGEAPAESRRLDLCKRPKSVLTGLEPVPSATRAPARCPSGPLAPSAGI